MNTGSPFSALFMNMSPALVIGLVFVILVVMSLLVGFLKSFKSGDGSHSMPTDLSAVPKPPMEMPQEVKTLLRNDPRQLIEAIKLYRNKTGAGLKESKEAIEAYLKNPQP